jgi:excisionase family DNA binding protein
MIKLQTTAEIAEGEQMEKLRAMNCADAAAYLNFSRGYLYRLVHLGKIPCYKPTGGKLFFMADDLDAFIFRGRKAADLKQGEQALPAEAGLK